MVRQTQTDFAILGLGVAGAATAYALVRQHPRQRITALDRDDERATSLTNQKWKHSGLLYPDGAFAWALWTAYQKMDPVVERPYLMKQGACFFARCAETLNRYQEMWQDWKRRGWEIPFETIPDGQVHSFGNAVSGMPNVAGGFLTRDSVIDYPALLANLCRQAEGLGVTVVRKANLKRLIREGDEIAGVVYEKDNQECILQSRNVIVALGAWSLELLRGIGVTLTDPVSGNCAVIHWKSHILTVETELVDRIMAWLDQPYLTVVPYRGRTLIASARRDSAIHADDQVAVRHAVEELKSSLADCFPALRLQQLDFTVHT